MFRLLLVLLVALAGCATAAPSSPAPSSSAPPAPPVASAPTPLERGQQRLARGELVAAATAFREALRAQPDLAEARAGLGLALYGLGDLDAAIEELRAAVRRRPEAVPVRLALARALIARQDWAAAREQLEDVASAAPELLDARYGLGVVRYAQGDLNGAIDAYRSVLAADPGQPDAHYGLGLMLTLAHRGAEATPEFLAAAEAGHPRAQYFAGTAYAAGVGVTRDLAVAIAWWFRAVEQGVSQAEEALAELRQTALGRTRRPPADRQAATQAFEDYRATLWKEFPDLPRGGDPRSETVGGALLDQGRVREAVPVLIREAAALSEPAQRLLETLYEQGVDGQLAARDARIRGYLQSAAAEGRSRFPAAR